MFFNQTHVISQVIVHIFTEVNDFLQISQFFIPKFIPLTRWDGSLPSWVPDKSQGRPEEMNVYLKFQAQEAHHLCPNFYEQFAASRSRRKSCK